MFVFIAVTVRIILHIAFCPPPYSGSIIKYVYQK